MTSEREEPEVSGDVSSVAASAAQSASGSAEAGTLLEVTFQKNPRQKYKYLEAEPKILGVTEIALTVFFVVCRIPFYISLRLHELILNSFILAFSCVGIISGSVAIAAQKLHLPTLKACLGMQVVTCVAYVFCLLGTIVEPYSRIVDCWYQYNNSDTCIQLEKAFNLLYALDQLTVVTQIVLSVTIAAYCCKVIPCCVPRSDVPVIVMTLPTDAQ
ncbi:uncharacterized protein LOC131543684 [Onychostoma macrolepis]|uniref:Uncharacterized protein n=1 Tax=Onychostoma macrolepis TaxID=369639 RepID=A0A7J6CWM4_9TELE|nr:uncharacterized protein LOC131543684 [Onychostoma macrolepis]KAF4111424.1 hypothetical protein G5714_008455 [Onychostoma macrolepis]